jgi:antitoxin YefM
LLAELDRLTQTPVTLPVFRNTVLWVSTHGGHKSGYTPRMDTVGLREAKDRLSALVEEVVTLHARYVITRHGDPAAVILSIEDLESMEETIDLLSTPGLLDAVQESDAEAARGEAAALQDYVTARENGVVTAAAKDTLPHRLTKDAPKQRAAQMFVRGMDEASDADEVSVTVEAPADR